MKIELKKTDKINAEKHQIVICNTIDDLANQDFSKEEIKFIKQSNDSCSDFIEINRYKYFVFIKLVEKQDSANEFTEYMRKQGAKFKLFANKYKIEEVQINNLGVEKDGILGFTEGIMLSYYQFDKYKSKENKKEYKLKSISVYSEKHIEESEIKYISEVTNSVHIARTLVNEPQSFMNTKQLSKEIKKLSKESGFKLEIFEKKQIESLKMGGLLAVNQGSVSQPNFSILSWNPENAKNEKPLILVGKGIVYDTGGLSLKPTKNSMDYMKSDMGGAAVVISVMNFVAKMKLPYYVIALVPATDNAISNKAYAPGDIISMHNQKTVEVLNTDAEGRLILADALSYAAKYKPELVIDLATLTGAAAYTLGHHAAALMRTASDETSKKIIDTGFATGERLVEFPLWKEYDKEIESKIADLKNIGGATAGAITAGSFLKAFTSYPWMHIDIAGPTYLHKAEDYKTYGGTGFGVRLLCKFISEM